MRTSIATLALAGAFAFGSTSMMACTADVHDNTLDVHDNNANIDDAKVEVESTTDTVTAGQTMHLDLKAEDVFLCDPATDPPSDRVKVAGHFEIFLDDMSGSPLLVTASESVDITIPATVAAGDHKVMCRIDKHDGTPTKATSEINVTVKASVSAN